jgi:hypothetical protein
MNAVVSLGPAEVGDTDIGVADIVPGTERPCFQDQLPRGQHIICELLTDRESGRSG